MPLHDKWLKIQWIKFLTKSFPTMPLGVDNVYVNVNPQDIGSVIAFALTSNIYLEGLAKLDYMDFKQILSKQQKNNTTYNVELLDGDDVLNYKHTSRQKIEAEMLT